MVCCVRSLDADQQSRGKATVANKAKAAPADVKAKALQNAQLKAVEAYDAEAGESESANFDAIRPKIIETPDRYILDTTVLSEDDNAGNQQYTVAVRVSLNVANLRNDLKASSAVGKATRSERSALSFLLVSREVDSIKAFDTRVTERQDVCATVDASRTKSQKGADQDPNSGLVRVAVTVNARVFDLTQTIPDTIASVGPVQYAGVGPTDSDWGCSNTSISTSRRKLSRRGCNTPRRQCCPSCSQASMW